MPSPKTRDAAATKARALAAAEEAFCEKGYAATSLRLISERSGASVPLIVFHFGSKEGLYEAVKEDIVGRYVGAHGLPSSDGIGFDEFLERLVRSMFEFYRDNPSMIRLSSWMRLEGDSKWWPGEPEWFEAVISGIRAAQSAGEIRKDMDPLNISGIICGSVHVWWEFRDEVDRHTRQGAKGADVDEQYVADLLSFARAALAAKAR